MAIIIDGYTTNTYLPLKSWYYDGVTAKTANIGNGGAVQLGDGTTTSTFPTFYTPYNNIYFDGTNQYINAGTSIGNYTNNFSLFCVINLLYSSLTTGTTRTLIARRENGGNTQYMWNLNGTTGKQEFYDGSSTRTGTIDYRSVRFATIAAVIDTNSVIFYYDGVQDGSSASVSITSRDLPTLIGAYGSPGTITGYYAGYMYKPIIVPSVLSPMQVSALHTKALMELNI